MNRSLALPGILLVGAVVLWQLWLGPRWTQRVPPGWSWEANFLGTGAYADPETGEFYDEAITPYQRRMSADAAGRTRHMWAAYYVPGALLTGGLLALVAGLIGRPREATALQTERSLR